VLDTGLGLTLGLVDAEYWDGLGVPDTGLGLGLAVGLLDAA
jgi:hypothetical protein